MSLFSNVDTSKSGLHQTYWFFFLQRPNHNTRSLIILTSITTSVLWRQSWVIVRKHILLAKSRWPVGNYFWSIVCFKTKHAQDLSMHKACTGFNITHNTTFSSQPWRGGNHKTPLIRLKKMLTFSHLVK